MTTIVLLWLLFALFLKHFIIDFPLQFPYQYKNKGTYGHLGGIVHAGNHAVATFAILLFVPGVAIGMAFLIAVVELWFHYHIDWAKMNINTRMGWTPTTHEKFWWLLGFDQFLHALTYLGIALFLV